MKITAPRGVKIPVMLEILSKADFLFDKGHSTHFHLEMNELQFQIHRVVVFLNTAQSESAGKVIALAGKDIEKVFFCQTSQ